MEPRSLNQILASTQPEQGLSLKQILASYDHISLTEEEIDHAILAAKIRKEELIRIENIKQRESDNRKRSSSKFDFITVKGFFLKRAEKIFKGKFILDEDNEKVFDMLCYYVMNDATFITLAEAYGVKNPRLEKGLLLAGNFGTGKSWLMQLFQQNTRQCYFIRPAKKIADAFLASKEKVIPEEYLMPFRNAVGDSDVFHQKFSGLCIDELGAENIKNNFGNMANVIGDLIEIRYTWRGIPPDHELRLFGPMLHATSNLSAEELKEFYGGRVVSRFREIFNFIVTKGEDRRK